MTATTRILDAAALRAADPRIARIVPAWAVNVRLLGPVVWGFDGRPPRPRSLSQRQFNLRSRRAREVDDLVRDRLSAGLIDRDVQAAFAVAVASVTEADAAIAWIRQFCPVLDADALEQIVTDAAFEPRRWTATQFGELLGLTKDELKRLGIRTFRAVGVTGRQMKLDRKRKHADRERARRARAYKPKAQSIAKLKPWEAAGISRRSWYRRKAHATDVGTESMRNKENVILRTKVVPRDQSHSSGAHPRPWIVEGISRSQWYRRAARRKAGASDQARSLLPLKANPSKGRAAPARGRAAGEGGNHRFFPPPGAYAARAAPIFECIPGFDFPASLPFGGSGSVENTRFFRPIGELRGC